MHNPEHSEKEVRDTPGFNRNATLWLIAHLAQYPGKKTSEVLNPQLPQQPPLDLVVLEVAKVGIEKLVVSIQG